MTLEISPVLAGTYDAPNYTAPNPIGTTDVDDTGTSSSIDSRRYTKFDRSATDAGTMTNFSFGDFVDMINPLQHIPLVSSIYRAATGDTINPVSRIVGNIVYGGPMGIASAILGGLGGGADDLIEQNSGQDSVGGVIASLFGSDNPASPAAKTELADSNATPSGSAATNTSGVVALPGMPSAMAQLASLVAPEAVPQAAAQTPVQQTTAQLASLAAPAAAATAAATSAAPGAQPLLQTAAQVTAQKQLQAAIAASAKASAIASAMSKSGNSAMSSGPPDLQALNVQKSFVLDPNKLPYGGVMAPPSNPLQGNNMAVALANSAPGMQMNHTVYTSKKLNSLRPTGWAPPVASATPPASVSDAASTGAPADVNASTSLPPALMSDIAALRAINQYRSTANQDTGSGKSLDVVN